MSSQVLLVTEYYIRCIVLTTYIMSEDIKAYIIKVYSTHTKPRETFAITVKIKTPPAKICL